MRQAPRSRWELPNVTLYAQWAANPPVPAGKPGEAGLGDQITVTIPAGATSKDLQLKIEELLNDQNLLTNHNNIKLVSPIFEMIKNFSENFNLPVTLTIVFDSSKVSGDQRAAVFYYDESKKEWVEVGGGTVIGNRITVKVDHFTKYAVFAVGDPPTAHTPDLSDISGHWAEANIIKAVNQGVAFGYPDGTFKPDKTVTRTEFAVMLMNALRPTGEGEALPFTDSAMIGAWARKAIAQASEAGIIQGFPDGTFRPDALISRAEMASMIAKALGRSADTNVTASFADAGDIPAWAEDGISFVSQTDIMQGIGANRFAPTKKLTNVRQSSYQIKNPRKARTDKALRGFMIRILDKLFAIPQD